MEKPYDIIVDDQPRPSLGGFLDDQINAFNMDKTGIHDGREVALYIREDVADGADKTGAPIIAGLYGWTWGGTCVVSLLWVREKERGHGLGDRLLAAAEAEARARKCRQILLSTHSFQAPEFYGARGFEIVATIDDYPAGHQSHTMLKRL